MISNKTAAIFLLSILFLFVGQATVYANPSENDIEDTLLEEISLDGVQDYWNQIVDQYGGYLPDLEKTGMYEFIKSGGSLSFKDIASGFAKYLFHELIVNGKLLGSLLVLTLFSVILQTMHTAFEQSMVSKIAYFVVYVVLIFIALNSFYVAVSYVKEAIGTMSSFMIALIPLLLGLMATLGNVVTVSFFHPIIILLINLSGVITSSFILPLLFLSALLIIISSLKREL